MSRYYATPLQRVLKCFIPTNVRKEVKQKTQNFLTLAKTHEECLQAIVLLRAKSHLQAEVLEKILITPKGVLASDLNASRSAIDSLVKKKLIAIQSVDSDSDLLLEEEFFATFPKELNPEQQSCLTHINASLSQNHFAAHLIYGVTGSGKTEVYMQAIQTALDTGKTAIMLVPEISLTSQTI